MLVNLKDMLMEAEKNHYAVPCFNIPNMEMARAVIDAAQELNLPVIVGHVQVHDSLIPIELIGPQTVEYAKQASVPVCTSGPWYRYEFCYAGDSLRVFQHHV